MEPRRVKYALGSLSKIEAKSIGEPGHRTFHLALEAGRARCSVWLEKEQLLQLGIYLHDAVQSLSPEDRKRRGEPKAPESAGQGADIEFKAGQLLLSHNPETSSFYLMAYEREEAESADESASVSFWITADQAENLAEDALQICAAGRPPCFLCGLPINPEGHVCPRSNGHAVFEAG